MKIGLIGAGKVGFTLGKFFAQGGVPLSGYYSRRFESACEAAQFTGSKPYDTLHALASDSDALFLTVPDGEITLVFQSLTDYPLAGKLICHCSGVMTAAEAFPEIAACGAYGYSIHPLFPISDRLTAYRELTDAFFCIEGDSTHLPMWDAMLRSLGARVQVIPAEAKVRYHAACAISSNLVCGLIQESLELLTQCGFSETAALEALAPLLRSNLEHVIHNGPVKALTGPVERGDTATVEKHLACLPDEAKRELYLTASKKLLRLAVQKNPERDYCDLENLLQ